MCPVSSGGWLSHCIVVIQHIHLFMLIYNFFNKLFQNIASRLHCDLPNSNLKLLNTRSAFFQYFETVEKIYALTHTFKLYYILYYKTIITRISVNIIPHRKN